MKNFFKNILKSNKIFYKVYFYLFSFFLKLLSVFVRTNKQQILFVVYGGKRYDDSPRKIYEYMVNSPKYKDYTFIWAFQSNCMNFDDILLRNSNTRIVEIDTFSYFIDALKSGYWVTNSSCSRGLNFKNKKTINVFFPHGQTGIKKIGLDLSQKNKSFSGFKEDFNFIFLQGKEYELNILTRAWDREESNFYSMGLPRNDELVTYSNDKIELLKKELGIPKNKKVILYAPTFREYLKDKKFQSYLSIPFDFSLWEKELSEEYVLLVTAHYEVSSLLNIPTNSNFIINQFEYPYINDLILVSDILISDYSSIIFDYLITEKPIFSYAYDFDVYYSERGLYPGYEDLFKDGIYDNEKQLVKAIKNINYTEYCMYSAKMKNKLISKIGNTTEDIVKLIFEEGIDENDT